MSYTSSGFVLFLAAAVCLYYLMPRKARWLILLSASIFFYVFSVHSIKVLAVFLFTYLVTWLGGILLENENRRQTAKPWMLIFLCMTAMAPLLVCKAASFGAPEWFRKSLIVPLGMSFYCMQAGAYLADVYKEKTHAQKNPLRFLLFISFFPQIIQGPIPRYEQLGRQLFKGHPFRQENLLKGFYLLLWGFFLKMMIADRAAAAVNTIFEGFPMYSGGYALLGGVLYSLQLYADFLSCVTLSQGAARLFGIELIDNFHQPYLATSVADFWRRWHISLSSWFRDYIYIPLGGNRKGRVRKDLNILAVFLASGIWHGDNIDSIRFVVWGILHAFYQIVGGYTRPLQNRIYDFMGMEENSLPRIVIQRIITFFLIMLGWIIFRAGSLQQGIQMIVSIFTVWNPWIFMDGSLLEIGLGWPDWCLLILSVMALVSVSLKQREGSLSDWLLHQHLFIRWSICLLAIAVIWVFGCYGSKAVSFIYGGF